MRVSQALEADWELDITRADDVLDLELGKLGFEAELLDDACVFATGETRVVLGLGTGDDHLAACKDECGGLGLANAHDDGSETLCKSKKRWVSGV